MLGAERKSWHLVFHPLFRTPLLALADQVDRARLADPTGYESHPRAKLLRRILDLILEEIPSDPASPLYRLGNTLGPDARGWCRAKFLGQFRLFFRFDTASRVIVYAWVSDETTLRKAGSASDPYAVFQGMLLDSDPPHDLRKLVEACATTEGNERLAETAGTLHWLRQ